MFRFENFIVIRLLKKCVVEIAISESTGLGGKACLGTAANRSHCNIDDIRMRNHKILLHVYSLCLYDRPKPHQLKKTQSKTTTTKLQPLKPL